MQPSALFTAPRLGRRVEVRGETADRFYIRGELNPGDRIADQGAFKLKDEALVRIQAGAS